MPFRCCTVTPGLAKISESTIRRLSLYLRILEELEGQGTPTASSCALADRGGTTAAQVRKDLSLFGSFGKRGVGYSVGQLATQLRDILGLSRTWRVALVGAGRIGSALLEYEGFRRRGFRIVAVVDSDKDKVGRHWNGLVVRDQSELEDVVRREDVRDRHPGRARPGRTRHRGSRGGRRRSRSAEFRADTAPHPRRGRAQSCGRDCRVGGLVLRPEPDGGALARHQHSRAKVCL